MDDCTKLIRALKSFADEHGLPNGVTPGELATEYTSLSRLKIGRLVRSTACKERLTAEAGLRITDVSKRHYDGKLTRIELAAA